MQYRRLIPIASLCLLIALLIPYLLPLLPLKSENSVAMQAQPLFKRIRIENSADINRLYPLILDYLREPARALSVEELVVTKSVSSYPLRALTGAQNEVLESEHTRDVSAETRLIQLVNDIGIPDSDVNEWVRTLTWMRPQAMDARASVMDEYGRPATFDKQDSLFAHHAAVVLLALCPNITHLTLRDPGYESPLPFLLLQNNYNKLSKQLLPNLKHVSILPTDELIISDERFYTTMDFLGHFRRFHRLPSIESIDVAAIAEDSRGTDWTLHPPRTANFSSINITHSDLSSTFLAALIGAPKALRHFSMSVGGRAAQGGGQSMMSLMELGKVLFTQKETLQTLDLDIDNYILETKHDRSDTDYEDDILEYHKEDEWFQQDLADSQGPTFMSRVEATRDYSGTIGSLHDFAALTHLSIGLKALLGVAEQKYDAATDTVSHVTPEAPFRLVDALPASLESLTIRGYTPGEDDVYDGQIAELLAGREAKLPGLVDLRGVHGDTIPSSKMVEDPDGASEEGGILWEPEERDTDWVEV